MRIGCVGAGVAIPMCIRRGIPFHAHPRTRRASLNVRGDCAGWCLLGPMLAVNFADCPEFEVVFGLVADNPL